MQLFQQRCGNVLSARIKLLNRSFDIANLSYADNFKKQTFRSENFQVGQIPGKVSVSESFQKLMQQWRATSRETDLALLLYAI
jgi:hypothetical protein